jgi:hypothetical protein
MIRIKMTGCLEMNFDRFFKFYKVSKFNYTLESTYPKCLCLKESRKIHTRTKLEIVINFPLRFPSLLFISLEKYRNCHKRNEMKPEKDEMVDEHRYGSNRIFCIMTNESCLKNVNCAKIFMSLVSTYFFERSKMLKSRYCMSGSWNEIYVKEF